MIEMNSAAQPPTGRRADIERAGLVAAIEQSADAVVITDTSGRIQYVNPAFTSLTGYSLEEAAGQNPRILKSGHQSAAFYKEIWDTIRSGSAWRGELINRRKDGTFYTEEMRITPVRDAHGKIVSYIAIKQDVTERRAAVEAQRFLAAIVEGSEDAIVTYTPAGIIRTWNRGAKAIFGYSAGDAIGKHVSMFVASERLPELAHLIEQVLQGSALSQVEGTGLHKDGRRVPVSLTATPIRNPAGEVAAISVILRDISERHEAEGARAFLASIVEFSADAIIGESSDGTIVSWNHGAELLFGYASWEIIGRNVDILAPPGRSDEVRRNITTVREGGSVGPIETVRRRKDGALIDVSLSASPIRNPAGDVAGASAIFHDIGERLRVERILRDSEERFRGAFENAPSGMSLQAIDGRYLRVNSTLCRMLGYSETELLNTPYIDRTYPDDWEVCRRAVERLLADPSNIVDIEKRYVHRSGNIVWARTRVSVARDAGNPSYFVVHGEDITERKQAEEALAESEDRFRVMADSCPTMIWVTNAEGGSQFINRTYREYFGTTSEEVDEGKWQLLIHPDDAQEYVEAFHLAVNEQTPFRAEARVRRADGEWRLLGSYATPRLSPGGTYLGHIGLSSDITERRQADLDLRASEEKFRQLAENIREVFWMMNAEGSQIVYVSPAYEQVWGYTCESLYQNPMAWLEAIEPEDRERAHELFMRQVAGEHIDSEYRIRTPDGQQKWIRDRAFPVRNRRRRNHSPRRNCGRYHYPEAIPGGAGSGLRGRRCRQRGQEPLPGQHEPRNPHAYEWRHRHAPIADGHNPHTRTARIRRGD
jgi:PAS domain S-box-containing protein